MSCGKWYCNSCMDLPHVPPLCKNCSGKSKVQQSGFEFTGLLSGILNASDGIKTIIKGGLCVFFAVVLGLTILFQIKGAAFLLDINYNFLRYIPAFFALVVAVGGFILLSRKPPEKKKKETITVAQVEALLKVDEKLTPSRLASATNTPVEYAKQVLNDMAVEGILNVSSVTDTYEVVYSKNMLPR